MGWIAVKRKSKKNTKDDIMKITVIILGILTIALLAYGRSM